MINQQLGLPVMANDTTYISGYQNQNEGKNASNQEIFEAFYIIGVERNNSKQQKDRLFNPKIQYKQYKKKFGDIQYQDEKNQIISIENIIEKFACPSWSDAEKIINDDIEEEVQRIICQGRVPSENFYMFNIKGDDLQLKNPSNIRILQQFNHSRQLYGYCLKVDDFLVERFQRNNQIEQIYWKFQKILCFVTYFPIQALFKTLFEQILFITKVQRQKIISGKNANKSEIDGVKINQLISKLLSAFILTVSQYSISKYEQKIEINFAQELKDQNLDLELKQFFEKTIIQYVVPKTEDLFIETKKLEAHIVLQLFSVEQFFSVFMEILKEGKIIFCCQNQNLLTAITSFFHTILQPFKWFHQVIYNLPIESLALLEFNQPMLYGVNMQHQQLKFKRNIIAANNMYDITFVDINEKRSAPQQQINIIENNQKSKLNWFDQRQQLAKYFQNQGGQLKLTPNDYQERNAKEFLLQMQDIIKANLIDKVIPKKENDFVLNQSQKLNDRFIYNRVIQKIQKEIDDKNDQTFIQKYVMHAIYFTEYLRFRYVYG
ncbi:unnamed protein product [Paramecium sonneborni]|uniref:cDENN domain-containing protein n=1 Tax=Paramecium sonneborni TaxID=65129 RepID=A0A8S1RHS4_9CILI|nr:unnamed protein product [Paramecium sonneborni]